MDWRKVVCAARNAVFRAVEAVFKQAASTLPLPTSAFGEVVAILAEEVVATFGPFAAGPREFVAARAGTAAKMNVAPKKTPSVVVIILVMIL